ncbi:hypothetical protein F5I97DRAFT_1947396 [Phlebopus sp. FC_14]|nr:hypothetical protein F5I97DRAFT_1947396 [Phlebopus sp. FC_14]
MIPPTPLALDEATFVSYVLPPMVCYITTAILVLRPQTRSFRIALWPLTAMLSLRAAVSVDMSMDKPALEFLNIDLLAMFCITERALEWTFPIEPLKRHGRPKGSAPSVIMDALDLAGNFRGVGWDWSKGLYVPLESRPCFSRTTFALFTLFSAVLHAFICGVFHAAVMAFAPETLGTSSGGTIFDTTLPPTTRYLRSSIISIFTAFGIYCVLQMGYDICTIVGVMIFRQDPDQWPPSFESPWFATSVRDFWGRRWHQWFRRTFVFLGGHPLSFLFGRVGGIFGAFFTSAVFHYTLLVMQNGQIELSSMLLAFGMMATGVVAEGVFTRVTGRIVGGWAGWMWTMSWLVLWGNVMVDGWARAGMIGSSGNFLEVIPEVRKFVEQWVMAFDTCLHTC